MKQRWIWVGLGLALLLVLLAPLASAWPDGLERVAENLGFIQAAEDAPFEVMPDYTFPGIGNEAASTIVAGLVGAVLLFVLIVVVGRLMTARRDGRNP